MSSVTDNGAVTPIADTESLADHAAIGGWLSTFSNNEPQASWDGPSGPIEPFGSLRVTRASYPSADNTFLIIDKSQNRALGCYNGHLHLENINDMDFEKPISGHWQWFCTEKDGFKGFQNVAERGFLGHDMWWNFYAKTHHHRGWESFTVDRREESYYWIQALFWWKQKQLSASGDGRGLVAQDDGGTLWEFVKVHL